jgi:hypothetical protein
MDTRKRDDVILMAKDLLSEYRHVSKSGMEYCDGYSYAIEFEIVLRRALELLEEDAQFEPNEDSFPKKIEHSRYRETIKTLFIADDEVLNFLDGNIALSELILEVHEEIRLLFKSEQLSLVVDKHYLKNPQLNIHFDTTIEIDYDLELEKAFKNYQTLLDEWWFPKLERENIINYPFIYLDT